MAYLQTATGPSEGRKIVLSSRRCVLGRSSDCDVVVDADSVSRLHATIVMRGRHFYVEDLNSSNGTVVNNEVIKGRIQLREGDRIRLSWIEFEFHDGLTPLEHHTYESRLPDQRTLIDEDEGSASAHDTSSYLKLDETGNSDTGKFSTEIAARWGAMIEITQALGQHLALDKLLPKVLDSLFKMVPQSERGCIILKDHTGEMRPGWVKVKKGDLHISRTVINDVMKSRHAIVSRNAVVDPRFSSSESVTDLQIGSIMCAPLIDQHGDCIGVIQVDTSNPSQPFRETDLEVLAAVAAQTAIAVTVARLHEAELRNRTMERELVLAAEVQRNCLPDHPPELAGYEFFDYYEPTEQIGGDYFDYMPLPDGKLGIVIADVVGHGIPAALVMSKFSAETRFIAASLQQPAAVLERLNDITCQSNRFGRFVTMAMLTLDPSTHEMNLAVAGHMPPILRHADGTTELPGRAGFGPPLGTVVGTTFQQHVFCMQPGEALVLYTDGLTEARNADGEEFGQKRLGEAIAGGSTAIEIGERVCREVAFFLGKATREDDLCVVCLSRT